MTNTLKGIGGSIRDKIIASGRYKSITEDEYHNGVREVFSKSIQAEQAQYKPDYERIGIREVESTLTWSAIKPGISDGYKAMEIVKPAYERGWGMIFIWGNWGQAKTLLGKIV